MSMMRKMFYMGLGAMSLTREKGEQLFTELVERGEMNKDEARHFIDDAVKKGEEERKETRSFIRDELEKLKNELPFITRSELEALQARITELENKINS